MSSNSDDDSHESSSSKTNNKYQCTSFKASKEKNIIDLKDYQISNIPEKGNFGYINIVTEKSTSKLYVTKTSFYECDSENHIFILRDLSTLISIRHSTIVPIKGFSYQDFKGNNNLTILTDYMENGSLADLLQKERQSQCPSNYDNTKRQIILTGIARAMMLLHNHHIIHRDLKPENILLDKNYKPRLTDYGLLKLFNPKNLRDQSSSKPESISYLAPEVITNNCYNAKSDVYSFGILMYEIVTGKRAYDEFYSDKEFDLAKFQQKISKEKIRPKFDTTIKKGLKKLIESCWSQEPNKRPTFEELFNKLSTFESDLTHFNEIKYDPIIKENDNKNNKNYFLDDVNEDEFYLYVEEIFEDESQILNKNDQDLKELSEKVEKLESDDLSKLESEFNELSYKEKKLSDQIEELKEEFNEIKRKIKNNEIEGFNLKLNNENENSSNNDDDDEVEQRSSYSSRKLIVNEEYEMESNSESKTSKSSDKNSNSDDEKSSSGPRVSSSQRKSNEEEKPETNNDDDDDTDSKSVESKNDEKEEEATNDNNEEEDNSESTNKNSNNNDDEEEENEAETSESTNKGSNDNDDDDDENSKTNSNNIEEEEYSETNSNNDN